MKRNTITFWVLTVLLIPALGIGSVMAIFGNPQSVKVFTSLGYPAYLSPFLGVARILALIVIFMPKYSRLKEWAYAGLAFDVIGAIYSQVAAGYPFVSILVPIISLALILGSYFFYHKLLKNKVGWQKVYYRQ